MGYGISTGKLLAMIDDNPLLDGVMLSGGEPFLLAGVFAEFATECRRRGLSVMTDTGYHYEELAAQADRPDRQNCCDRPTSSSTALLRISQPASP